MASLRVVYELSLSVPDANLDDAIASLIAMDFTLANTSSIQWFVAAHTYMTVPGTEQGQHLYTHVLPENYIEHHYREMMRVTEDIRSLVMYVDPVTSERVQLGGDWITAGPANAVQTISRRARG